MGYEGCGRGNRGESDPSLDDRGVRTRARFLSGRRALALRCRWSTNNEDLPEFSGAGLRDSFSYRSTEGPLEPVDLQVYASL